MRYPVMNLGITADEYRRELEEFRRRFQPPPYTPTPPPPPTRYISYPRIPESDLTNICKISEADREDPGGRRVYGPEMEKWLKKHPDQRQNILEYIAKYCPSPLATQLLTSIRPPVPTVTRYGGETPRQPVATPPTEPAPPPLPPLGPSVPTVEPPRPPRGEPDITPATIGQYTQYSNDLWNLCKILKAIAEDTDPRAREIYRQEAAKILGKHPQNIAETLLEYLARHCDPLNPRIRDVSVPFVMPTPPSPEPPPIPTTGVPSPPVYGPRMPEPSFPSPIPMAPPAVPTIQPQIAPTMETMFAQEEDVYPGTPTAGGDQCPIGTFPEYPGGPCRGAISTYGLPGIPTGGGGIQVPQLGFRVVNL